jgi:MFS family permease
MKLRDLHPTTKRLVLARAFRSVGQGALVVDLTLYLQALGWNGFSIGAVLSAAGLFGALLSLIVGVASDRLRRRPFILVYESITLICGFTAFFMAQNVLLSIVIIVAGFGRGANGAAGPFSPVEQAWLAEEVASERRGWVYSLNSAFGFFGMGIGALLAILPSFVDGRGHNGSSVASIQAAAYRPLFLIVVAATVVNLFLIFSAKERYGGPRQKRGVTENTGERALRRRENKSLAALVFLNSFNGLAVGFTGPLISYWFAVRFHVGPASIAPIMAATFFITGISSVLTGRLSEKIGIVKSVVWARFFGLLLLILLPLVPFFWLASLVYLLRSAFNRGSVGARQALTVGLVRDERRGFATSLNALSMQLPQSMGPSISGYLFGSGELTIPFYAGALFQGVYLLLYNRFFGDHDKISR